ncbi:MAG TPA: S9 family peptidase [Thermomicrobiales bacterium]|nr:S9 family peptidase [Thermomicrobiales bacterium]
MTTPISPERAIYDIPSLNTPRISPDGSRIAYVRGQVNQETCKSESQIWISDLDGSNRRRLTWTGTRNGDPVWSPDGSQIAFVTVRDGDRPNSIAILGFDGGESRVVTSHSVAPGGLAWSPDGTKIAYSAAVDPYNPNETPRDPKAPARVRVVKRIDYKQDGYGFVNDVRSQIFVVDVTSGERTQLTSETIDHGRPAWSPDGSKLAVSLPSMNGMISQIGILDVASAPGPDALRRLGPAEGSTALFAWSPDGTKILFDGSHEVSPHHDYYVADVASGEVTQVTDDIFFLPDVGYQSNGPAGSPVWLDESTALVHGLLNGASGIWKLAIPGGETTEVARWKAMHSGFTVSPDHKTVIQVVSSLDGIVGLNALDVESGASTLLFNEAETVFAETPVAPWELVSIERGGLTIEGWLLAPHNFDPARSYPLILDVHGGPHNAYGYGISAIAEVWATHDFFVLLPNPRGSGTYGRAFAEAVTGDWGNEDWKDLEGILEHVLERPYIDRARTGIYGYSYGGYMTAWVIGNTDRFVTAICGAPVFDSESMFGTSDIGHRFDIEMGGLPWGDGREQLMKSSPSTYVHNAKTPTLIVQGEADERCPVGQAEQLFISLLKLGVETEFVRYPGGSHLFINSGEPAHRLDYFTRTLAWFKKYLGDPAERAQ